MGTDLSEDTLAYISRVNYVRMAKICRMCFEDKRILNINIDRDFRRLLLETLPDDRNFPQFICQDCRKVIEQMHRFSKRSTLASQLVQSFIAKGGSYPESKPEKRSASPDRDQRNPAKKQRTSMKSHLQVPENNKENSKLVPQKETIDGENKKTDRRKLEAKRKNIKDSCEPMKKHLSKCTSKSESVAKDGKGNIKLEPKESAHGKQKEWKLEAKQKNVHDDYKMTKEYLFGSEDDSESDYELRF